MWKLIVGAKLKKRERDGTHIKHRRSLHQPTVTKRMFYYENRYITKVAHEYPYKIQTPNTLKELSCAKINQERIGKS